MSEPEPASLTRSCPEPRSHFLPLALLASSTTYKDDGQLHTSLCPPLQKGEGLGVRFCARFKILSPLLLAYPLMNFATVAASFPGSSSGIICAPPSTR